MLKLFGGMQNTGYSPVKPESNHCIAMFHKNVECRDCKTACNTDAIKIGRPGTGISVDSSKCTGCEKCISACNYGAFKRSGMTEKKWCDSIIDGLNTAELVIGCKPIKAKNMRTVNCLGSIHVVHVLYWLSKGIKKVVFKFDDCGRCGKADGDTRIAEQLRSLETFTASLKGCSVEISLGENEITLFADGFAVSAASGRLRNQSLSRRDFFKTLGREFAVSVNDIADAVTVQENSAVDFNGKTGLSHRVVLFRETFSLIKHLVTKDILLDRKFPLCTLQIDKEKCSGCGICIKLCPTGALKEDTEGSFNHNSLLCNGCGVCTKACNKGCISVNEKVLI
ncbi:MAG: 4Fe-4S binding protein [Seleniivibrio sp.]|nr:4Fe-4S binding protein [Seleniivibrio sp.]